MCFKNVLSKLLKERGLKQTDLVNLTGIPSSLISNYIKGVKIPRLKNALKIANALGVSLEELMAKEESTQATLSQNNDEATVENLALSPTENKKTKDRIKELRQTLGLSQAEFSKKIEYSQCYAAELESGRKRVNDRIVSLICDRFDVNEDWLRNGEGAMFVKSPQNSDDLVYVVQTYSKLSPALQRFFLEVLRGLAKLNENESNSET